MQQLPRAALKVAIIQVRTRPCFRVPLRPARLSPAPVGGLQLALLPIFLQQIFDMTTMDNYTIGGAAIVLTALIVAHMSSTKRAPAPLPPGPRGLPLVGNVADLPQSQPWLGFAEFEEKYGTSISFRNADYVVFTKVTSGGITHLSVLGKHIMILNDPKYAVDMLDKKSKIYSDRPQLIMAGDLVGWGAGPALIPFGKTWSEYRKLFAGFMGTRAKVDAFDDILNEETHKFLKSVVGKPEKWVEHAFK